MEAEIKNECLRFRAGDLSGEHLSLRFLDEDTEYVWQPRPGHWERGSFVCFPLLGRLPGGSYLLDGRRYELPMHGFAQHRRFALTEQALADAGVVIRTSGAGGAPEVELRESANFKG